MKCISTAAILLGVTSTSNAGTLRRRAQTTLPAIHANDDHYEVIQTEKRLEVWAPGIMENDGNNFETEVTNTEELDNFQGKLKVKSDGSFTYEPPTDGTFEGQERFTYETCQSSSDQSNCASATVHINVKRDPNRPDNPPKANDDTYEVHEGAYLEIDASGFLSNDEHESNKDNIYRSSRNTDGMRGSVNTHSDGSFEYTAPEPCWTGEDYFYYRAAYESFPEMESNEAKVTIRVTQDPNRPEQPKPEPDSYDLYDGTTLEVKAEDGNGLLWNDLGGELLYIKDVREHQPFYGELKVDSDGSFRYTSESGRTGDMRFDYDVWQEGWEQCVQGATTTVTLRVTTDPNKPSGPATPVHSGFEATQGERLDIPAPGVLYNDKGDDRYTLYVVKYDYSGPADMKVRSDGSMRYESPADYLGTDSFTYEACYVEYPDLCYTGTGSVEVKPPLPPSDDSNSRRGVATAYFVRWGAADEDSGDCEQVQPRINLECGGEGELSLVDIGTNDNHNCFVINGIWSCVPTNEGQIYVECRDGRATNSTYRQLHVELVSEPVKCEADHLATTYHVGSMRTLCSEEWLYKGMDCTGSLLQRDDNEPPLCYGTDVSVGPTSMPKPITMTATNYEQCLYF